MNVEQLIDELQRLPRHARVCVAMRTVSWADEGGEGEIDICQTSEAQTLNEVRYEGNFVGLYA